MTDADDVKAAAKTITDVLYEPVDPTTVVPGYETDMSAVGTNREVDPALVDDVDWKDVHDIEPIPDFPQPHYYNGILR